MRTRIISSLGGLIVLFAVLSFFGTIVVNVAVSLIALLAVFELLSATGCTKNKLLAGVSLVFSALVPFFTIQQVSRFLILYCYVYVIALFCILLGSHRELKIEQIAVSFMCSLMVPFSLATLVYQRDRHGVALGIFYVLVSLGSAWLSDTSAYFAGRAFGKHKLAPYISPKKTVEGAAGGVVGGAALMLLVAWLYSLAAAWLGSPIQVHYLALACVMPLLTVVSIVGDLSASIIKRQYGVKDYGSIMPGHGGVMDRFDSALMVAPLVYMISQWVPLARLLP